MLNFFKFQISKIFHLSGAYSVEEDAVTCTKCPVHQYNSVEGSVQCMKCPDTAFTWSEGTDSFSGCIGPVIEVSTSILEYSIIELSCNVFYRLLFFESNPCFLV